MGADRMVYRYLDWVLSCRSPVCFLSVLTGCPISLSHDRSAVRPLQDVDKPDLSAMDSSSSSSGDAKIAAEATGRGVTRGHPQFQMRPSDGWNAQSGRIYKLTYVYAHPLADMDEPATYQVKFVPMMDRLLV